MRKLENTGPVHKRLYESNKKASNKKSKVNEVNSYTSKRTLKSENTVFDRLVKDAQSKQERIYQGCDNRNSVRKTTSSNRLLLKKRFEREFDCALQELGICYDSTTSINEVTMTSIMAHLGFIQTNEETDLEIVLDIWQYLQPSDSEQESVIVRHLRTFLNAILGYNEIV